MMGEAELGMMNVECGIWNVELSELEEGVGKFWVLSSGF